MLYLVLKHRAVLILLSLMTVLFNYNLIFPQSNPAYMTNEWVRNGGPIGGIGYDIRYNFENPDIWYVTDGFSGMHVSTDNGLTWHASNDGITNLHNTWSISAFCTTVDPIDSDIIWMGTQFTGKIYKSTDAGNSWVEKRNGVLPDLTELSFRGFTVDPRSSDIVYAMGEVGSSAWNVGPTKGSIGGFDMTMGVVYKTIDGGENWTEMWRGDNLTRYCWIRPDDPETIFVSTGIFDRHAANADSAANFPGGVGILKSTDGGTSWTIQNETNGLDNLFLGSLYMHPVNPDIMLACAGSDLWGGLNEGIYLTENSGDTWIKVVDQDERFGAVEFSEADPNIAYSASPNAFYRSEDGGHNWIRFNRPDGSWGPAGFVIGFPIDIQCDPRDPYRLFVNSYLGGNFLSLDGGESWVTSSNGYSGARISRIVVMPGASHKVYCGTRSGIFRSNNGGDLWEGLVYAPPEMFAKFNEIVALAVDPSNSDHVLCIAGDYPQILYSYNGGYTWNSGTMIEGTESPIIFNPSNPSIVYASFRKGFYTSNDGGENWVKKSHPLTDDNTFPAMVIHPNNNETLFASKPNGTFVKTTDGGTNWTALGVGLPAPPFRMVALAIDKLDPDVLYAGFNQDSDQGTGVYKSIDGGSTWVSTSVGMDPNTKIKSIVVDPTNSQIVYAGGFGVGLYYSTNAGTTWQTKNDNLSNRDITVIAISDDGSVLYAGTSGAGIFRLGNLDPVSIENGINEIPSDFLMLSNYPNPFNSETNIFYWLRSSGQVRIDVYNNLGEYAANIESGEKDAGFHSTKWNANNFASGVYLIRVKQAENVKCIKVVLQK